MNLLDLYYGYYRYLLFKEDEFFYLYRKLKYKIDTILSGNNCDDYKNILGFYYYMKYREKIAPWFLHLCVTDSCQLKCKHCYFGDYPRMYNMSSKEVESVIKKFFEMRDFFIQRNFISKKTTCNVAGGEPLCNSEIVSILNVLPENKFDMLSILSNGLIINDEVIDLLMRKSEFPVYQISLDGLEKNHDFIRGNNTFNKTIQNIKILRHRYPKLYIQIAFNAHSKNYEDAYEVAKLAKNLGCNKIFFDRYVPYWNSGLNVLNQNEFNKYQCIINKAYTDFNDSFFLVYRNRSLQHDNKYICMAGIQNQICESNGNRIACTRYHLDSGNFYKDDINSLIEKSIKSEIKTQIIPYECLSCINVKHCMGGMRCLSFAKNNEFTEKDINCNIICNKVTNYG